jgi:acyl-CoA synthetase (AMP-forming)/AMP-acid ligase II
VEHLSYAELYEDAGRIAGGLSDRHGELRGERIALVFPTSGDSLRAFFGVLAAGATPVPLPPPLRFSSPERFGERIRGALCQSRIRLLLGSEKVVPILEALAAVLGLPAHVHSLADLRQRCPAWQELAPQDSALVQYTSGSTAAPKGVVLTHGQIVANLDAVHRALAMQANDVCCSWLPLFHDMGLIGSVLGSMYGAIDQLLMPPDDFAREPLAWLRVVSSYRATLTVAPNWAYGQCLDRIGPDEAKRLDLASCRVAISGAEMVDAAIARRFAARFQPAGFRPEAMLPGYGLAEAGVAASFSALERGVQSVWVRRSALSGDVVQLAPPGAADAREVVSVGKPVPGMEIDVVVSDGHVGSEGRTGEIVIRGPSVTSGYDRDAHATDAAFREGWLRTGDLGFLLDGELYVTGRSKDVIIIRGQNIYATDVAALAAQVDGVWSRNAMAIGVPTGGTEGLVLLAETRARDAGRRRAIAGAIRETVSSILGATPLDVVLLRPGELPRTSSGKLERHKGVSAYEHCCAEASKVSA